MRRPPAARAHRNRGAPNDTAATATPTEAFRERRIRDLTVQMADIDRELQEKTETDARLRAVIVDYQGRLDAMPTRESELVELTRDYATLQDLYRSLLTKREESEDLGQSRAAKRRRAV